MYTYWQDKLVYRKVFEKNDELPKKQSRKRDRGDAPKVPRGGSKAWLHFIKIYDKCPELEGDKVVNGAKVVFALCRDHNCNRVLKPDKSTHSLLIHSDKHKQPSSSERDATSTEDSTASEE